MSVAKHTPGPWTYQIAVLEDGTQFASVSQINGNDIGYLTLNQQQVEANARLIAAAPDLLAACKLRVALWDDVVQPGAACEGCPDPEDVAMARAAIAKAEGAQ